MKARFAVLLAAVAALVLSFSVAAAAQNLSKGEVAVAYTFEKAGVPGGPSGWNYPAGFTADLGLKVSRSVTVVAEIGISSAGVQTSLSSFRIGYRHYMGGLRLDMGGEKIVPFVQLLGGGVTYYESSDAESNSGTGFGIQPGVGVDVRVSPRVAVRAQADYQYSRIEGWSTNHLRLGAGVAFFF